MRTSLDPYRLCPSSEESQPRSEEEQYAGKYPEEANCNKPGNTSDQLDILTSLST